MSAGPEKPGDGLVCVRSWGTPVIRNGRTFGYHAPTDRGPAAFDTARNLIVVTRNEGAARRAIVAHADLGSRR